jgi:hypothetical protein
MIFMAGTSLALEQQEGRFGRVWGTGYLQVGEVREGFSNEFRQ